MKGTRLKFAALLSTLVLVFGVTSQTITAQSADQSSDQTTSTSLTQRLAERKAQLKTRLTGAQTARLKDRCKPAQATLTALNERIKTIERNRVNAYDKITDRLEALVSRIGDAADTTELETEIGTFKDRVEAFQDNVTAYRQILSDLTAMDCAADPTAFKASLEAAKSVQSQLLTQSADIRGHLNTVIKPAVAAIRATLTTNRGAVIN